MINLGSATKYPVYGMVDENFIFGVSGNHTGSEGIAPDFSISNYVELCVEYDCYAIRNSIRHEKSKRISRSKFYKLKKKIERQHKVKLHTRFKK